MAISSEFPLISLRRDAFPDDKAGLAMYNEIDRIVGALNEYRKHVGEVIEADYLTLAGGTMIGEILGLATDENGLDVDPVGDADADLITVGVTGTPKLFWDEAFDRFSSNKGIEVTSGQLRLNTGVNPPFVILGNVANNSLGMDMTVGPTPDTSGNSFYIRFFIDGGAQVGRIENTTVGTTVLVNISDARLKSNIRDAPSFDATAILKGIRLREYEMYGTTKRGYVAQEIQPFLPEAVSPGDEDNPMGIVAVTPFTRVLWQFAQEQIALNDDLQTKVTQLVTGVEQLEAQNTALEARLTVLENAV